jgi:hypothetical protein
MNSEGVIKKITNTVSNPVLSYFSPIHTITAYISKFLLNITFLSTSRCFNQPLFVSSSVRNVGCLACLLILDLLLSTKLVITQVSPAPSFVVSPHYSLLIRV